MPLAGARGAGDLLTYIQKMGHVINWVTSMLMLCVSRINFFVSFVHCRILMYTALSLCDLINSVTLIDFIIYLCDKLLRVTVWMLCTSRT